MRSSHIPLLLLFVMMGCDTTQAPEGYPATYFGTFTFLPETSPVASFSYASDVTARITPTAGDPNLWGLELFPCDYRMIRASDEVSDSGVVQMHILGGTPCIYTTGSGREVELTLLTDDVDWSPEYFDARLSGLMSLSEPDGTVVSSGTYEGIFQTD